MTLKQNATSHLLIKSLRPPSQPLNFCAPALPSLFHGVEPALPFLFPKLPQMGVFTLVPSHFAISSSSTFRLAESAVLGRVWLLLMKSMSDSFPSPAVLGRPTEDGRLMRDERTEEPRERMEDTDVS